MSDSEGSSRIRNAPDPDAPLHPRRPTEQNVKGHFIAGNLGSKPGAPGLVKRRARRALTTKVMQDLWADWRDHGAEAIARLRKEDVSTYVRCAVSLLPKDITLNVNPIEQMPDDRLLEYIRSIEQAIVTAIASSVGAPSEIEGGTCETIIDQEADALPALQEAGGIPRGGMH